MQHALLGPSKAEQWINCPGSIRATEDMPDSTSEDAENGHAAHEMAEAVLKRRAGLISPQKFGAERRRIYKAYPEYADKTMEDHAEAYAEYVLGLSGEDLAIETQFDLSDYFPESFGTSDCTKADDSILHVIDYKYGKGVPVKAEGNSQLKCYALGAITALGLAYDFEDVIVHIFQPRLESVTAAEYKVDEILAWAESVKPQAQKAWDGAEEFKAGPWCRWCKKVDHCKFRQQEAVAVFDDFLTTPEDLVEEDPTDMTDEEIAYWLTHGPKVIKFIDAVLKYAEKEAVQNGQEYEGFKVVEGRSNRKYADIDPIIDSLSGAGIDGFLKQPTLLGITALEKLLGKAKFKELVSPWVVKPEGKPVLVPESDKRPSINRPQDVFND